MAEAKLHYQANGTWPGYVDVNAGDPTSAGPGTQFALAGYGQTYADYQNVDGAHHILSMGDGHNALFLDDSISPNPAGGSRLQGIDVINGGNGGQIIDLTSWTLSYGNVTINAGSGDDIVMSNAGNDSLKGGAGNDYLWGGSGNDTANGGTGNDTVLGGTGNDVLGGGAGNDSLDGGAGNDIVAGGSGNDTIVAGLGNQQLTGGSGNDVLDFSKLTGTANFDPGSHVATLTQNGITYTDKISSFETIIGTDQGNFFDASQKPGLTFIGGAAGDRFHSEGGGSTFTGGGGGDVFDWMKIYQAKSLRADVVTDFQVGTDHLDMSDFLKGQTGLSHPTYAQVVHLIDNADGTMVQVRAGGAFHDAVELNGVHNAALNDLLLH